MSTQTTNHWQKYEEFRKCLQTHWNLKFIGKHELWGGESSSHCIMETQTFLANGEESRWVEWFLFRGDKLYIEVYELADPDAFERVRSRWNDLQMLGKKLDEIKVNGMYLVAGFTPKENFRWLCEAAQLGSCENFTLHARPEFQKVVQS